MTLNMRTGVRSLLLATVIACLAGCHRAPEATRPTISSAELAQQIQNGTAPLILDVRTADEYRAGHIPGAVNIPIDELQSRLPELKISKSAEVVVHCEHGGRAAKGEAILAAAGYDHVVDLDGHMAGWRESKLPEE